MMWVRGHLAPTGPPWRWQERWERSAKYSPNPSCSLLSQHQHPKRCMYISSPSFLAICTKWEEVSKEPLAPSVPTPLPCQPLNKNLLSHCRLSLTLALKNRKILAAQGSCQPVFQVQLYDL